MDVETLEFRAACIQAARNFFIENNYLELDTPALASSLIPETCLEVFRTEYIEAGSNKKTPLFLVPSPEVFIKPIIAKTKKSVFQLSKCYRNLESKGKIHNPEFSMLEYYTVNADYIDSIKITECFFNFVAEKIQDSILADTEILNILREGFLCLTMDEAFKTYAGFSLAKENSVEELAHHAERLGLGEAEKYRSWKQDDLYELILVHAVEPSLPKNKAVALLDYPAFVPCLSAEKKLQSSGSKNAINFTAMERWEVYVNGVELANCYTECRDKEKINAYFQNENILKQKYAAVPHPPIINFGDICENMPQCSGVAMGFDRFIMLLAGKTSLDSIMP